MAMGSNGSSLVEALQGESRNFPPPALRRRLVTSGLILLCTPPRACLPPAGAKTSRGKGGGGRRSPIHTLAAERGYPTLHEMSAADTPRGCTEDREVSSPPASSPHASATLCYGAGLERAERAEHTMAWRTVAAPPSEPKRALSEQTQTCSPRCQERELLDRCQERELLTLRPELAVQNNKPSFLHGKESDERESGIGVIFRRVYGDQGASFWKVIAISKGGAAAKDGTIRMGMHLKQIGDVDVRGMEAHRIAPLILGPKNSKVTLKMMGPVLGDSEKDPEHYVSTMHAAVHRITRGSCLSRVMFVCAARCKQHSDMSTRLQVSVVLTRDHVIGTFMTRTCL